MVHKGVSIIEQLFWTAIWIFLILIAGYAVLAYAQNKMGGNVVGNVAAWISNHAQPHQ